MYNQFCYGKRLREHHSGGEGGSPSMAHDIRETAEAVYRVIWRDRADRFHACCRDAGQPDQRVRGVGYRYGGRHRAVPGIGHKVASGSALCCHSGKRLGNPQYGGRVGFRQRRGCGRRGRRDAGKFAGERAQHPHAHRRALRGCAERSIYCAACAAVNCTGVAGRPPKSAGCSTALATRRSATI